MSSLTLSSSNSETSNSSFHDSNSFRSRIRAPTSTCVKPVSSAMRAHVEVLPAKQQQHARRQTQTQAQTQASSRSDSQRAPAVSPVAALCPHAFPCVLLLRLTRAGRASDQNVWQDGCRGGGGGHGEGEGDK